MTWENYVSSLAVAYLWGPIFMFVVFQNRKGFCMTLALVAAIGSSEIIKRLTRSSKWKCLKRPDGAKDCNISNGGGVVEGRPGFPSGHCATSAAFWTCVLFLVPLQLRFATLIVGSLATAAMMWARMKKRCHTFFQSISGVLLGVGIGTIAGLTCF
jgi:membrane-associated phospholipid phosphatase